MARSNVPTAVRDAAKQMVAMLLAQPDLVAMVSRAEIQRQVDSGALIPLSKLQMGPGLVLAPMGRVTELENAILSAVAVLETLPQSKNAGHRGALGQLHAALLAVLPEPTPSSAPTGSKSAPDTTVVPDEGPLVTKTGKVMTDADFEALADEEEQAHDEDEKAHWLAAKSFNGGGDGKPLPTEPDGRPRGMPTADGTCEVCGADVPASQGQMSFTRFRKVLCRDHFVSFKQPVAS